MRTYFEVTKPRIAGFVMITAGVAYYVASGGNADYLPMFHTLLGSVLATGGALALNQYLERDVDGVMKRTQTRPIPSGRLAPREVLILGVFLILAGVGYLWATVGWLPAAITLASAVAYDFVYTPLKPRSYMATFAGAIPGAMPALIGWSAATGTVSLGAWVLFGIAFLWQIPHVLALAWLLRDDYRLAGFLMTPPADPEGKVIGRQMILYATILLPASLAPTFLGLTGTIYLVGALILGMILLWWSALAWREMTTERVRRVFLGSLAYQPLLLGLMLIDTVRV